MFFEEVNMFGWARKNKTKTEIVVNSENLETRVAVIENGRLEEFQVEHPTEEHIVGSIYKGTIQNLEHDLQAAFVDIGLKKNAFLHYWDMNPDDAIRLETEEGRRRYGSRGRKRVDNASIERQFPAGSSIIVQVTKGPIGTKGPRVTASLSIPGKYLVMMPGSRLKGVSRKISDLKDRQLLKKMLAGLEIPQNVGVIIRTAALGAGKKGLIKDLTHLSLVWKDLEKSIKENPAPCCLYQEPDLVERVVRDWLTEDIDRIVIDSRERFDAVREVAGRISRKARSRVQRYEGDLPIFDYYEIERQLDQASQRKVPLKSGGYIVFDETEALIAIDVNTGRHKGNGSQEEAIFEVNIQAVEEVARQLRLRNIGGLVVVDLIDMKARKHQNAVYRAMKAALKRDRARTNVLPISDLGILEMTRQRAEQSLQSSMYVDCPYCHGKGSVRSPLGMSVNIQRQISAIVRKHKRTQLTDDLQVVVHPTVLERLKNEDEQFLMDLQSELAGHLSFKSDSSKHMEYFAINNVTTGDVLYSTNSK
ncbi:MAG: Rne/Rng family ribonuclease [Lentisphaerae bacterium]|nr:Rne/Rng family ribonuclease [Lentisphaerota bacterium]